MGSYADINQIRRDTARLVKPPIREPLSQSARRLLHVSVGDRMERWRGDDAPYMWEPMDCLQSRRYDAVIFVGPARTSKTVSLVDGWACHNIVNNPSDMLIVQISEEKAREYSKKRLQRAFEANPLVRAELSPRPHDNNVHDKIFRAGNFLKIGWPSKNIFASSDWKYVAVTDYDRMPLDIGGEGSAFILAGKRTQSFMSSGMVLAESSPGFNVLDPKYRVKTPHEAPPTRGILSLYNQGDRRLFMWQCPTCGEWFEADYDLLVYDRDEPDPARASEEVFMRCPHNACALFEDIKYQANLGGLWVPEGCYLDQNGVLHGDPRPTRYASFWQKGPTAAFQTWNQLVYKYLAAAREYELTGNLDDLKATVNTDQGRPLVAPGHDLDLADRLQERQADLGQHVVPSWVRFTTAQVDVQGGKSARFEVLVLGWGAQLENTVIDRFSIEWSARTDDDGELLRIDPGAYPEDWELLTEQVVQKAYPLADDPDRLMPVLMTACDSGGEDGVTDNAYTYWRSLKKLGLQRKLMLVKGASSDAAKLIEKRYPDNSKRKDRKSSAAGDVPVWFLHTDRIKNMLSKAMERETRGWRYMHFPDWLPSAFFDELTAETRGDDGKWRKSSNSVRNEATDHYVYGWAVVLEKAANKIDWDRPPRWAAPHDSNSEIITASDLAARGSAQAAPRRRRRR